jgi:hypothetical protein
MSGRRPDGAASPEGDVDYKQEQLESIPSRRAVSTGLRRAELVPVCNAAAPLRLRELLDPAPQGNRPFLGTPLAQLNPRAGQRPVAPLLLPWAPLGDALRRFGASTWDRHTNGEQQGICRNAYAQRDHVAVPRHL